MIGGLGSAVAEVLVQNHPVPVKMVGMKDTFGRSGKPNLLMEYYGLTAKSIIENVKEVMKLKK